LKNKYSDLIEQTFEFPTEEFATNSNGELLLRNISLMDLVKKHGTPVQFSFLPKISENIQQAKQWFEDAFLDQGYQGNYHYCYCTKSSHFKYIIQECLKNDVHIETSSAYDLAIIKRLAKNQEIKKDRFIICNGFKTDQYIDNIIELIELGFENLYVVIDNTKEFDLIKSRTNKKIKLGIRIASEE